MSYSCSATSSQNKSHIPVGAGVHLPPGVALGVRSGTSLRSPSILTPSPSSPSPIHQSPRKPPSRKYLPGYKPAESDTNSSKAARKPRRQKYSTATRSKPARQTKSLPPQSPKSTRESALQPH